MSSNLKKEDLRVVTVVEGAVGNAKECLGLGVVGVLAIALQKGESRHKVTLLQEVVGVWQSQLLLLNTFKSLVSISHER